jgi:adenine-specific DNA-methyltransferase
MMNDRLRSAAQILNDGGVTILSIGREEVFRLEMLCDEIFGSENQIGDLVWEKGRKNDAKFFSLGHDYLLVYARSKQYLTKNNTVWREEKPGAREILEEYRRLKELYRDNYSDIEQAIRRFYSSLPKRHPSLNYRRYNRVDKNGVWRDHDISWPSDGGPNYEVPHPVTGIACKVPSRGWRFATYDKFKLYDEHGFIEYREDHTEPPILKRYLNYVSTDFDPDVRSRRVVSDGDGEETSVQVMPSVFYKHQERPVQELRDILGRPVFKNPKDPEVLSRLFLYIGGRDDLFLDFFGGSGSAAHAVITLNRKDRGRRKYIMVEMADYFDTVMLPRIKKVVFSDKWKDGKAQNGQGVSHFVKYYQLEQYEDTIRKARYEDADLFDNPYRDPYSQYVFLRDLKMLETLEMDSQSSGVTVDLSKLYENIDLAETISHLKGKWIKTITSECVELEDGENVSLSNPDYRLIKPLVWW